MSLVERFNKYSFLVLPSATKGQIKSMVEKSFSVKVMSVRTKTAQGKAKRAGKGRSVVKKSNLKKAIVKLAKENKIGLFEAKGDKK